MIDPDDINAMVWEAYYLKDPKKKIEILEEAIKLADSIGDIENGYDARDQLIKVTSFSGYPEKTLVAFAWCLARFDEEPDQYDELQLLWKFKWFLSSLPEFTRISLSQIQELDRDFEIRLRNAEYSLRPLYSLRLFRELEKGNIDSANEIYVQWDSSARDKMADCIACDQRDRVVFHSSSHLDSDAIGFSKPILSGEMKCTKVPLAMFDSIISSYLRLGEHQEAEAIHKRYFRKILRNPEYLETLSQNILYLSYTKNYAKALKTIESKLPWTISTFDESGKYCFYSAAHGVFEAIVKNGKRFTRKLNLPVELDCYREDSTYDVNELSQYFLTLATDLANLYDQRNGTDAYSLRLQDSREYALGNI